ncbi:M16 family metallopeptidase [Candidatus Ruminimicrobium bovinum]|uniref:M16 family metallopeptidase n=1 Tax=Candidatus Ruminimicrobium bovinum TaxID=3242779 RepID=UPI0039B82A90
MKKIIICILLLCSTFLYADKKGVADMKFPNGLELVIKQDTTLPVTSVHIFVGVGSVNEKPEQAGLSHFIEHLLFKGSKNYPSDLLSRNVENMGGLINAFTSNEMTCYHVSIQKDGYIDTLKMLIDTVSNPLFPADEIEKERKVVIEEIQRHKDNPRAELFEFFLQGLYKTSDYKNSVIGTADIIANVKREEIQRYFNQNYRPNKMVVAVTGDVDIEQTKQIVKDTLCQLENPVFFSADPTIIEPLKQTPVTSTRTDNTSHSYMLSGFLGPDISSKDMFSAIIAMDILGAGKSSRLYRVLKEEKNLVLNIGAAFENFKGTGTAYIFTIFDKNKYEDICKETDAEIEKFAKEGPTKQELEKAKINIKANWLFENQTVGNRALNIGFWHLMGHADYFDNYVKYIDKIKVEDIKKFMAKYYSKQKLSKAVIFQNEK